VRLDVVHCEHAAACGGCDLLGTPYAEQLDRKRSRLAAAIAAYPVLGAVEPSATRGADPVTGYRTRLKWMAGRRGALGLFARGGHTVVDVPGCRVASPTLAAVAATLRALRGEPRFAAVDRALRAVDLREVIHPDGRTGALVTLVLIREERPRRSELEALATSLRTAHPEVLGVAANWAAKRSVQVLGPETELVAGVATALDRQGDVAVTATHGSFVQAHRGQAAAMAKALVDRARGLGEGARRPRVLELFAGASPFGLALAAAGMHVTSVESFAPAVEGARAAAAAQGLRLEAIAADAEADAERRARAGETFDLVVVDPPRRGLSPRLRGALGAIAGQALAYVSCDPDTLARDLADLAWSGLAVETLEPWDFVPLTEHVEALAWLARAPPVAPRVLARAGGLVIVDAPPHLDPRAIARRVERSGDVAWPIPRGASGALALRGRDEATAMAVLRARVVAAVRGVPRRGLRGVGGPVEVRAVGPGRALIQVEVEAPAAMTGLPDALLRGGHPVIGDPRDAPTARHVLEKHGVDRPLLHVVALDGPGLGHVEAPLAPDLAVALERLGLAR
jgi:23S rRNA (uracil1939-C5)-methyltransferase